MSLAVIIGIKSKGDIEVKNKKSRDIWCKALKSKTQSECDILEELWGNWPTWIVCDLALVKVGDTWIVPLFEQFVGIWREMVDDTDVGEIDSQADWYGKLVSRKTTWRDT